MLVKVLFLFAVFSVNDALFLTRNFDKVNLKFIYGPSSSNQTQFSLRDSTQLLSHKNFNSKLPTVLYISGWTQSPDAVTTRLLVKAYLKRGDYNILLLDWSDYSVGVYGAVMIRISKISRIFGRTLAKLFDKGLNAKSFHCVGHSFGAHSCGIIGRELYQVTNRKYKLGRITGLDPAGPGFYPVAYEQPLNPEDAEFVDSIHSDVFFVGTKYPNGHVDFYPNYNMVQPTCPPLKIDTFFDFVTSMCSHFNAVRYWVDSLSRNNEKKFPSYQCANWEDFESKKCKNNPVNYMGLEATPKSRGKFFVKLNSKHHYNGKNFYLWLLRRIEQRAVNLLNFNFH